MCNHFFFVLFFLATEPMVVGLKFMCIYNLPRIRRIKPILSNDTHLNVEASNYLPCLHSRPCGKLKFAHQMILQHSTATPKPPLNTQHPIYLIKFPRTPYTVYTIQYPNPNSRSTNHQPTTPTSPSPRSHQILPPK